MQRKFLEDLGIEKDIIDKIMGENGKDIKREKDKADNLKTQLDTAKETLRGFEGVDVAKLQAKITQLTADLESKDNEYAKKIADRDFDDMVSRYATEYKAHDIKAVIPFLDVEKLKSSKNQNDDLKAAFETVKKEKGYLFEDKTVPRVLSTTPGNNPQNDSPKTQANEALRSLFGKE